MAAVSSFNSVIMDQCHEREEEKFATLAEAIVFLSLFQMQALTYLQDLRDMEQCLCHHQPCLASLFQRRHMKDAEKEANHLFEKLRAKLTTFMNTHRGIRFL